MTLIDPALPRLIPEGHYTFEIAAEPEKKKNQWGGFYWQFMLIVRNGSGQHYEFSDIFNQKEDRFHDLLIVLGGKKDSMGITRLPDLAFTGRRFEGEIKHFRSKTNKDKVYDRIVNISPSKEKTTPAEETIPQEEIDAVEEEIPF